MATNPAAAARRKAQRQLARDLKAGKPILPKQITAPSKKIQRSKVVDNIVNLRVGIVGGEDSHSRNKFRETIVKSVKTGKARTSKQLRDIEDFYEARQNRNMTGAQLYYDAADYFEDDVWEDISDAFYYH